MEHEFPTLEYREYQNEFLKDWWSLKKLFRGSRASGKTTMMLCEYRRFRSAGFNCILISHSRRNCKELYNNLFGERFPARIHKHNNLESMRGRNCDVAIIDGIQNITQSELDQYILPQNPLYIRASEDKHYKKDFSLSFDSVYTK